MSLLSWLNPKIISIDIGVYEIKIVVGRHGKKGIIIEKYFSILTPEGSYNNGNIINGEFIAKKVKEKLKKEKIKTKKTYLTINSNSIITREIIIPKVEEDEIQKILSFQLEDYLPGNPEMYITQFKIIDIIYEEDREKYRLLLIAMPKEIVEGHFKLLKDIGLIPLVLDYQSNSLSKVIRNNEYINNNYFIYNETLATIDIGYHATKVSILKNGIIQISRSIDIGTENIDGKFFKDFYENLNKEIEMIFRYYLTRDRDNKIDTILLFGGGTNIQGLSKIFTKYFNIPSIKVESFSDIEYKIEISKYINSIGLLIREKEENLNNINFFESYIGKEKSIIKKNLILFLSITSLILISLFYFTFNKIKTRQFLEEIATFKIIVDNNKVNGKVNEIIKEEKKLEEFEENLIKAKVLDEYIENTSIIDHCFLKVIKSQTPKGINLITLNINLEIIEIVGYGKDEVIIADFTRNLEDADLFQEVFILNISKHNDEYKFVFNISLKDVNIVEVQDEGNVQNETDEE